MPAAPLNDGGKNRYIHPRGREYSGSAIRLPVVMRLSWLKLLDVGYMRAMKDKFAGLFQFQ